MPKKYSAKQVEEILKQILNNAYKTISDLNSKLSVSDSDNLSEDEKKNSAMYTQLLAVTMELVNDIVSPGHEISIHFFKDQENFIKQCMEHHVKFVETCEKSGYVKEGKK